MKTIAIVPSRYSSTRLPGKPLVDICGKPMIQWVYEAVLPAVDVVLVATDHREIFDAVLAFGGKVVYTSKNHKTGTDRVAEAYKNYCKETGESFDVVLNIQGDEPLIKTQQVVELKNCFLASDTKMATLASFVKDPIDFVGISEVFLVTDKNNNALYFSRFPIPYFRAKPKEEWYLNYLYKKHIGLYGFTPDTLMRFVALEESSLEITESLEQNRWLENGGKIKVAMSDFVSYPVDTPEDLKLIREKFEQQI